MTKPSQTFLHCLLWLFCLPLFSQEAAADAEGDQRYREDQFYVGVSYNLVSDVPSGVNVRSLSGGIQFGFLRDMPINKKRSLAIAIGAGLALDQIGNTLFIGEELNEKTTFTVLNSDVDFDTNRFSMATIEAPIEFRWRNSNPTTYKFWRIYGGVKFGYVYWYRSYFKQPGNTVAQTNISEFDRFRVTGTLAFGRNTVSLFANYSINPFFKDAFTTEGQRVDFRTLRLGMIFYIL